MEKGILSMTSSHSTRLIFFTTLSAFFILFFQNCSRPSDPVTVPSEQLKAPGNGDYYGGKLLEHYYHVDADYCRGQSNPVRTELELINGYLYYIRKDCQPIERQPVLSTNVVYSSLNNTVILLDGFVFAGYSQQQLILPSDAVVKTYCLSNAAPGSNSTSWTISLWSTPQTDLTASYSIQSVSSSSGSNSGTFLQHSMGILETATTPLLKYQEDPSDPYAQGTTFLLTLDPSSEGASPASFSVAETFFNMDSSPGVCYQN